MAPNFQGVWVAAVTPWDSDAGQPALDTLKRLARRCAAARVAGLFVLGTTGEGTLMDPGARRIYAEAALEAGEETHLPIIVHVGHDRPDEATKLAEHARRIGAAAIAAAPPTRYRLNRVELEHYYIALADSCEPTPFFLYDIPGPTGNPLDAELLQAVGARTSNTAGAKVSREDWPAWQAYLELSNAYTILVGKDEMALPLLELGAAGLVSSGANVFPDLFVSLYETVRAREYAEAAQAQGWILRLSLACGSGSTRHIRNALSLAGLEIDSPMPPLLQIRVEEAAELRQELETLARETPLCSLSSERDAHGE
jgi:dihydrodipicolinate synthase/N-acetylneuraminate lyase